MTSSATGSDTIRLGGLISGFDTQGIIDQILAVDQQRIDDLEQKKEVNQAKVDTWTDLAQQLRELSTAAQKLMGEGTTSVYDAKTVNSLVPEIATATASAAAIEGSYNIVTTDLAQSMVVYGTQQADGWTLPAGGDIILNGETITLVAGDTLDDVADRITNGSYASGLELEGVVIDNRLVIQTKDEGALVDIFGTTPGSPPFNNGVDDPSNILQNDLGIIDGGGDLTNISQLAQDAAFTINGMSVTRDSNTIADLVEGITFTLSNAGSTTIKVETNTKEIKESIIEFVDLYNETRDLIDRTRNAKLDENDQFGLFFSDPLMRDIFNEIRSLSTGGISMGGADWDGTVQANGAAVAGATQITVDGFTNATGTLKAGDQFVISGDSTVYTLLNDATIAGNAATLDLDPPLVVNAADNVSINLAIRSMEDFGVGIRNDTVSGTEGVMGILDEGKLDGILKSNLSLIAKIFGRDDTAEQSIGSARRLYDYIDRQTKVSVDASFDRAIDDTTLDSIQDANIRIDEQIDRLTERLQQKEQTLIEQFTRMESALAQAQSSQQAISGIASGGAGG